MTKITERKRPPQAETTKPPLADQIAGIEAEIATLRGDREKLRRDYVIAMALKRLGRFAGLQLVSDRLGDIERRLKEASDALEGFRVMVADPVLLYTHAREFIGTERAREMLEKR